jgi:hypothetical protein
METSGGAHPRPDADRGSTIAGAGRARGRYIDGVNYLAHGRDLLERPYALAGAALPDWLKIAERRARVDPARIAPRDDVGAEIAAGVRAHHDDDARFHACAAFTSCTDAVTADVRARFAGLRASVLAHVLVEMLLDAWLEQRTPGMVDRYYAALAHVDARVLADVVAPWLRAPAPRLPAVVDFFRKARFVEGYEHDHAVAARLAGISRRVGMGDLPDAFVDVVTAARPLVAARAADMLR